MDADLESPEEMMKKDPLATQVWKLYSRAKSQLPNAQRMENLTWRMMSMKMSQRDAERRGYAFLPRPACLNSSLRMACYARERRPLLSSMAVLRALA